MRSGAGTTTGPWGASSSDRKVLERVAKHSVTAGVPKSRGGRRRYNMECQMQWRSSSASGPLLNHRVPQHSEANSNSHNPSAVRGDWGGCEANNGDSSRRCGREMSGGAGIDKSQSVPGDGGNGYQALDQSLLSPGRFGVNINSTGKREPRQGPGG